MVRKLRLENYLLRPEDTFYIADNWVTPTTGESSLHEHDFYEFFFSPEGQIFEAFPDQRLEVERRMVRIVFPHTRHWVGTTGACAVNKLRNIAVRASFFEERLAAMGYTPEKLKPTVLLDYASYESLVKLTDRALQAYGDPRLFHFLMSCALDTVLIDTVQSVGEGNGAPKWMKRLLDDMQRPENYILGLARMIELSGRSQSYLNRCFRKYCGVTSTEWINRLRIGYAAELLKTTDRKVVDIAYECGFDSVAYFNKLFKQQYLVSPRVWRQRSFC